MPKLRLRHRTQVFSTTIIPMTEREREGPQPRQMSVFSLHTWPINTILKTITLSALALIPVKML